MRWERYPRLAQSPQARAWLTIQANLGRAANTIDAYGRALEDYLAFSLRQGVPPEQAGRDHIAAYLHDLRRRPPRPGAPVPVLGTGTGLANATLQQRLTAIRLYYDYLMEEGLRAENPVGRGRYTPGTAFGGTTRGLLPRFHTLPWIPDDAAWLALLEAARAEPARNRVMFALAYDAGLRREELCALETGDLDPAARLLRVRAAVTKGHRERIVPYSAPTGALYAAYLAERRHLSQARGPLFLSASRRNRAQPITIWTWSKVVAALARRAGVPQFTTHTFRHLCLTDLARAGWALHEIALFAGHRHPQTTLQYIHLSGCDLAAKLERGMAEIHTWRTTLTAERLA
ncbi:MAG TPA: site-specific integrase [Nitrolancea sp.]|nr:site-specific integrase [Nitrolancea sp.]